MTSTASAWSMTGARSTLGAELTVPAEKMDVAISVAEATKVFGVSLLLIEVLNRCTRDLQATL